MELTKKEWNNGYYIDCKIGKRMCTSWWSSPPKSIDHVSVCYLTNRYPLIRTEYRSNKFKELFKKLWVDWR
jgi:hypothetical protein